MTQDRRVWTFRKVLRVIKLSLQHILLGILGVIWIIPPAWLVITSFRGESGAHVGYILPKQWTISNYTRLFTETGSFNYPRWYANTFVVAIFSTLLSSFFVLATSYALSRLRFKGRTLKMNIALILGMFPGFMSMIAVYHILVAIGLRQSLVSLVLVYSGGAGLGFFIAKGFFDTLPKSLDEAALIDGATRWQIMWKIILPLSRPTIVYTVLTSFLAPWVDFIMASIIMKDNYNNYTIAVGLVRMLERENIYAYYTRFCAGAVLIALPTAILFMFMQKYYVDGVTSGAVKG